MRKQNKRFAAVMALSLALTMVFSSVSVNAATKKVKSMTLSAKSVTLEINDTKKVTVKKVTPAKASKKVTWKSNNKKVATVTSTGVITAKAEGKATITATSKSNKKVKKTVKVTVKPFEQHYVNAETVYGVLGSEVVLDVRPAEKYAAGHVPGAVAASVKDGDVEATFNAVVEKYGKNTKYYLVCNSGNTLADMATTELQKRGVATSKIFTLGGDDAKKSPEGGWVAWTKHYADFVVAPGKTAKGFEFNHIITKEVLKKELAKGEASKVTVIDVRDAEAYANGHIPGAVSAPLKDEKGDLDDAAAKAVISKAVKTNPNKLYAVCCYTGNKYANRAKEVMTLLGMDENKHLCIDGGYTKWAETEDVQISYNYVNAKQVYDAVGTKTVILDVRADEKFAAGHIPGSVAASVLDGDVKANYDAVVAKYGQDATYYLVCNSGNKLAEKATKELKDRKVSYKNIFTLGGDDAKQSPEGGWVAWSKNYPDFVATTGESSTKILFQNNMTVDQVKKDINGGKKLTIVDVRDADSTAKGTVPGASIANLCKIVDGKKTQVSMDEAKAALKPIVEKNPNAVLAFVCFSGNNYAKYGREVAAELGISEDHVVCLTGGYAAWSAAK